MVAPQGGSSGWLLRVTPHGGSSWWLLMVAPQGGSSGWVLRVAPQGGSSGWLLRVAPQATLTISRVSQLIRLTILPFVACITSYLTISLGTSHPQATNVIIDTCFYY